MKYLKSPDTGEVFAFEEDGSQDEFIPTGLVEMTADEVHAHLNPRLEVIVPASVSMMQARLAMLDAGVLDDVERAIESMEGLEGRAARIQWEYAQFIDRDWPLVEALGGLLGWDSDAVDRLFISAGAI